MSMSGKNGGCPSQESSPNKASDLECQIQKRPSLTNCSPFQRKLVNFIHINIWKILMGENTSPKMMLVSTPMPIKFCNENLSI